MSKPFLEYTYDDAKSLFNQVPQLSGLAEELAGQGLTPRRSQVAKDAAAFFNGDHWQDGRAFIGQLPGISYPGASQIIQDIKKRCESENVVKQVVETHDGGMFGREPLWSFLKEVVSTTAEGSNKKAEKDDLTGEMLTPWWNEREALADLQKALRFLLLEGIAVKRIFFPRGILPETGTLTAPNINKALDFIFFETLTADKAGVFKDDSTQKQIGIYLFDELNDQGDVIDNCAELSFLNDKGETVCRVVKDKGKDEDFGPYQLGGRLLVFEMRRSPLITEQVQSNQKALNLAHTMMTRNVNMAGSRERSVTNAQPPRKPQRVQSATNSRDTVETSPGAYETGAGAVMFLMGYPIRNETGDIIGYTNPNVTVTDPASVQVFTETRAMKYEAILSQCHQRHLLIQGDAMASGVSRKQAEKGYQRSLKDSKTVLDAAGRWQLEVALRLAAQVCNQTKRFLPLRADFNCLLDTGEPDPDDIRVTMEMRKPGGPKNEPLISDETARQRIGIEDPSAELKRIEGEAPTPEEIAARQPIQPVNPMNNNRPDLVQ